MRVDEIRRAKNARPFKPFRLRLTDGEEIPITHPDAVAWDDKGRIASVISGGDHYWVEIALVTAIVEALPQPMGSDGGQ
ncbi:MAG: hypothetical protein ACP5XB_20610 [Isosphaeraceae bacterium]